MYESNAITYIFKICMNDYDFFGVNRFFLKFSIEFMEYFSTVNEGLSKLVIAIVVLVNVLLSL